MSSQDDVHDPASYGEDRSRLVVTVTSCLLALATMAIGLRIYTRWFLIKSPGPDDYAAIVSLLFISGFAAAFLNQTKFGLGRHIWAVPKDMISKFLLSLYVSFFMYSLAMTAVKVTFLLQYNRVFATTNRRRRLIFILATVVVLLWCVFQILDTFLYCRPLNKFWNPEVPGQCQSVTPSWYIITTGMIITDIIIVALPLPILKSLKLRTTQKIILLATFSLGFLAIAMPIIRLDFFDFTADPTWETVGTSLLSIAEITIGIICATIPALRPLAARLMPGYLSSFEQSHSSRSAWISRQNKSHNTSGKAVQVHVNSDELELARIVTGPNTQRGSTERSTIGTPDHSLTPQPPLAALSPQSNRAFNSYHDTVTMIGANCLEQRGTLHTGGPGCIAVKHDVVVTEILNR